MAELVVVEGVSGVWHYHIAEVGHETTAICGAKTMPCAAPLSSWGFKPEHMRTSYCAECGDHLKESDNG